MSDSKYLYHFIDSIRTVFDTMLQLEVSFGTPGDCQLGTQFDVSAVIGMSGDFAGTVALRMGEESARAVIAKFAGVSAPIDDPDFLDAIGELVNMIAGSAKARFAGKELSISTPSVIVGRGHRIACPVNATCVTLPCAVSCGRFSVDVAILERGSASKAA